MKFNKKVIAASLSTAMGLSLVGAIGGTIAWYQYSTKTTTSVVATSVAKSGVLQISTDQTNWMTDLPASATGSTNNNKLYPMTFGQIDDGDVPGTVADHLGYVEPEIGRGEYSQWTLATKGKEYLQYDVYLRSFQLNSSDEKVFLEKKVYLSDIHIENVISTVDIIDALRIHIAVEDGSDGTFLISKNAVSDLELYGELDLDGNDEADTVGGYVFEGQDPTSVVTYGIDNETQSTTAAASLQATQDEIIAQTASKAICTTPANEDGVKLTITIWLEGWHQFESAAALNSGDVKAMWNPEKNGQTAINVGLTFDVGKTF